MNWVPEMLRRASVSALALAVFAFLWECAGLAFGWNNVPSVARLLNEAIGTLAYNPQLASYADLPGPGLGVHVLASFSRAAYSVFGGAIVGISVAIAARSVGIVGRPLIALLDLQRVLPPLMFVPLTVFWFAPGEPSIIFAATAYSASTFALFALKALRDADARYEGFMAVLNESTRRRYLRILLPSALPALHGGFRLCSAITIGIVLVIEFFVGQVGLGKVLQIALYAFDVRLLLAAVAWAIAYVFLFDLVVLGLLWVIRPDVRRAYE
jgi:ABC-type nitrate/sulfonate/bicarbonate transport system permease component